MLMTMNTPRLMERMKREGMDAIVATAPENVTYTSGFWAMSQWIRRGPQAYVLTPAEGRGEQAVIASTGTLDLLADQEVPIKDVRRYGFFAIESDICVDHDERDQRVSKMLDEEDCGDAVNALVAAIKDRGLDTACIGVDEIGIIPQYLDKLAVALPRAKIKRAAEAFRHARAVKTPEEVVRLRGSARVAELSIDAALAVAKEGATERQLAYAFHAKTIAEGGTPVLVRDIARVEMGSEDYDFITRYNGKPATGVAVTLATGANALDTAKGVNEALKAMQPYFPAGLAATEAFDTTPFVRVSIIGVIETLLEAVALVFLVMFLFLQNLRATLIPTIAVPVVLLGTFAALAVMGFSINMLTMFGLVLAIGLVVDDAIVVVEAVEHHIEQGMGPREATLKAMDEVAGPVVALRVETLEG